MLLQLAQTPEDCDAVTHSGLFHSDEVMATAILSHCGIRTVARISSVPQELSTKTVVYDIGGGRYDHHMIGGNGMRETGSLTPPADCSGGITGIVPVRLFWELNTEMIWKLCGMLLTAV